MIGILTDVTKCIGCNKCVEACKQTYDLPPDVPRRWQRADGLSARNWTSIIRLPGGQYVRKQCRHCLEPACATVCLVGALYLTKEGVVVYDAGKCIGCRYCLIACPYGIPRYDWDLAVPFVQKCMLCYERIGQGLQPACTEACPTQATIFGQRKELLAEARRRMEDNPKLRLYGASRADGFDAAQDEIGGTSVLYLSEVDLSFLSYGKDLLGQDPLPLKTALALGSTPVVFVGVGAGLVGLRWIIGRRMKLQEEKHQASQQSTENEEGQSDV